MIRGIDVSHYQGSVDWADLKKRHSLSFGAAKCSEGLSFVDSFFQTNWRRMKAAGLHRIAYHYATPGTPIASSARAQAAKFVALVDPQPGDALCLDLEKSSLSQGDTNDWMRAFGDALRDLAPGITTIAYLGGYAANGSGRNAVDHFDRWWYPRYATTSPAHGWPSSYSVKVASPNTTGWPHPPYPHIWQWSPNLDHMDANVSPLTVDQLFNTTPKPPPTVGAVEMFTLKKVNDPAIWLSTGQVRRHIPNATAYQELVDAHVVSATPITVTTDQLLTDVGGPVDEPLTAELIAAAVLEALPPGNGGPAPTATEIADAVAAKFSTLLGGTS